MKSSKTNYNQLSFILVCVIAGLFLGLIEAGCHCVAKGYDKREKERFEKYMEGYRARMAGCTGINWNK